MTPIKEKSSLLSQVEEMATRKVEAMLQYRAIDSHEKSALRLLQIEALLRSRSISGGKSE